MALKITTVVPPHPAWQIDSMTESAALDWVFGEEGLSIDPIGSTSIRSIHAKPIDILIQIKDINRADGLNNELSALGYTPLGKNGPPGQPCFIKGGDKGRSFNVQVFQLGHPEIKCCLDFRDYLRTHTAEARACSQLKPTLAVQFSHDVHGDIGSKDDLIKETIARARSWRQDIASATLRNYDPEYISASGAASAIKNTRTLFLDIL